MHLRFFWFFPDEIHFANWALAGCMLVYFSVHRTHPNGLRVLFGKGVQMVVAGYVHSVPGGHAGRAMNSGVLRRERGVHAARTSQKQGSGHSSHDGLEYYSGFQLRSPDVKG